MSGSVYIGKPDGAGNEKFVTTTCPVKEVEVCLHLKTGISSNDDSLAVVGCSQTDASGYWEIYAAVGTR